MSQADELERLARLLDEGKLTVEEFETAKRQLLGSAVEKSAAAGWYKDPTGTAAYEAYWDGHRWTGATRPVSGTGPTAKRSSCRTAAIVGGLLFLIPILVALFLSVFASNSGTESNTTTGDRPTTTQRVSTTSVEDLVECLEPGICVSGRRANLIVAARDTGLFGFDDQVWLVYTAETCEDLATMRGNIPGLVPERPLILDQALTLDEAERDC
jgi:hypothetical protein